MLLIKNGNVYDVNGKVSNNTDILIEHNKIIKIDKNINIDDTTNIEIIDATNKEVFPGFIDSLTYLGCMDVTPKDMDNDESCEAINLDLNVKYAFNPYEALRQEVYKVGITSVGVCPTNKNLVGGNVCAFKTHGNKLTNMIIKENIGKKLSASNAVKSNFKDKKKSPQTKMAIFDMINELLIDNKLSDKLFINVNKKSEIDALLNITKDCDLDIVMCGAYEIYNNLDKEKHEIIIGDLNNFSKNNRIVNYEEIKILAKNDFKISISNFSDGYSIGSECLLWNAIDLYKKGISYENIFKMITINPARILNIDDKVGSLEIGKDADIVIYNNNPIKTYNSCVEITIINGNVVYEKGE